ncbi:universal stress protein [Natrarchaeobius oligotrophus]|uniref:Universal stress protein n=1 Tax=Natrarchaeobius chitinivorans TaxID=1679083 RepID=A0A3N6PLX4_NATCH|nr:universal stress protein [Natrarchaeobius chitinivorans]RQH02530.1 universal stress protein [Natrarchaeobius chitinivorans]
MPTDHADAILVATDGSDASTAALERALAVAERTGAVVHLLAVADTAGSPMTFGVDDVEELELAKRRLVDGVVETIDDRDVDVSGVVRRGAPAREIVRYADETDVDAIVLGRTGRAGAAGAMLGSTADRVLRRTGIPVLVVPDAPEDGGS